MTVPNVSLNDSVKVQNNPAVVKQNTTSIEVKSSENLQRQPQEDNFNGKGLDKKKIITYASVGTVLATLVGIALDFRFAEGKHVKNLWSKLTGHTQQEIKPNVKPEHEIVPEVEVPVVEPEPIKITDVAKAEYEQKQAILNGKIKVNVHDEPNLTLKKMSEYYELEEHISSLPQLLKKFEVDIKSKTTSDLKELESSLNQQIKKYRDLVKERYDKTPPNTSELLDDMFLDDIMSGYATHKFRTTPNYEKYTSKYLSEYELAEFEHLESKQSLVEQLIKQRRQNLRTLLPYDSQLEAGYTNILISTFDDVPRIEKYIHSDEQLSAFYKYYDAYPYNYALRKGEKLTKAERAEIKLMDEVFEVAPELDKEHIVYRAIYGSNKVGKQNVEFVDSIKEGMTITDKSYISTSINTDNPQFLQFFNGAFDAANYQKHEFWAGAGAVMRIKLPKGTKGVLGGYDEYLLPRNSKIKVNKIQFVEGVKIIDCEYILPKS